MRFFKSLIDSTPPKTNKNILCSLANARNYLHLMVIISTTVSLTKKTISRIAKQHSKLDFENRYF